MLNYFVITHGISTFAGCIFILMRILRNKNIIFVFTLLLFGGCKSEDSEGSIVVEEPLKVTFDTYLQEASGSTRVSYPTHSVGELTESSLRTAHFGVFSMSTGNARYAYNTATAQTPFNFMFNQEVGWGGAAWSYEPVKYWPNDNQPADDQTPPAQGSQEHSYLSFYAYAPYFDGTDKTEEAEATGLVRLSANDADGQDTYVTYKAASSMHSTESVDLLWSRSVAADDYADLYKTDGSGYVNGQVSLKFIHALSRVTFDVQAVIDRRLPADAWPEYPVPLDANTKVFVESVEMVSPVVYSQGNMYLTPHDDKATVPYWDNFSNPMSPTLSGAGIQPHLLWGGNPASHEDATETKADFDALPAGVTHEEQNLFSTTTGGWFMFPPTSSAQPLTVHVVYDVITYDPSLKLNTPRYYSIIRNDITQTTGTLTFESNKSYTLKLLLGLTTVKFDVEGIEDWAVPIMLDGVLHDPGEVTKELDVE